MDEWKQLSEYPYLWRNKPIDMSSEILFLVIVFIILFNFSFEQILDWLNLRARSPELPEKLKPYYNEEKYVKSYSYHRENYHFSNISGLFSLGLILVMLSLDGFAFLDDYLGNYIQNEILLSISYFAVLAIGSDILSLPFSYYSIFHIEEKYGFNKMTVKTFVSDKIKSYLLGALIGGILLYAVIWFYQETGTYFWLWTFAVIAVFMLFMTAFYTSTILPIFNKLTPLEDGELRDAIERYAKSVDFQLDNIFIIDGSKRSTKANAFFSGLGKSKKIVLYDTLVEKHTTEELVAILAHEVGHYKKKHSAITLSISLVQMFIMLYILGLFLDSPELSAALGVSEPKFHIGLIAFTLLYSPISLVLGIGMNMLSRKHEFEADAYARDTYDGEALARALIKLSTDHLSNLTPHKAYVFIHYSHPPVLNRVERMTS